MMEGIPIQAVERLIRVAYVLEAAAGVRRGWGESPNASQIAVKTGLDRHTVREVLRDQSRALRVPMGRRDPVSKVVEGWMSELAPATAKSSTVSRRCRVGADGASIYALIRRYAPGVSPRVVLDELLRRNIVLKQPDGLFRLMIKRRPVDLGKRRQRRLG
jgi:hypothetical protein